MLKTLRIVFILVLLSNSACTVFGRKQGSAQAYVELAERQLSMGQTPQALSTLLKGLEVDSGDKNIHHQLGITYFIFNKYEKSAEHFRKAVHIDEGFQRLVTTTRALSSNSNNIKKLAPI